MKDGKEKDASRAFLNKDSFGLLSSIEDSIIFVTGTDLKIIYVNDLAAKMAGLTPDEVRGKSAAEIFPKEGSEYLNGDIVEIFKTGKPMHVERLLPAVGGKRWINVLLTPVKNGRDEIIAILGIAHDITEQHELRERLHESEERYHQLIETSPIATVVIGLDRKIQYANGAVMRLFGVPSLREVKGRDSFDFVAPAFKSVAMENLKKALKFGSVTGVELNMLRADGSGFLSLQSASVLTNGGGKPNAFIVTCEDITEKRKTEDDNRRHEAELEKINKVMVGRELKMVELKREIAELKKRTK